jgi:hypothetical protein
MVGKVFLFKVTDSMALYSSNAYRIHMAQNIQGDCYVDYRLCFLKHSQKPDFRAVSANTLRPHWSCTMPLEAVNAEQGDCMKSGF